jgi:hypothetical protein
VSGFVLLALLNCFFLLHLLLFSLRQADEGHRRDWLKGFLIWLALEVTFMSTLSMVVSNIAPFFLAFESVKEVSELFRAAVASMFHEDAVKSLQTGPRARKNSAGEVVRESEQQLTMRPVALEEPFNISWYFFVSRRLASEFPQLVESKVVEQFRSVVPNRPYSRRMGPLHAGRVRLRWAACVQSATAVVLYCLLVVMSAIPSLEYFLLSVVGWLLFGFLSHIGDFHLLGVHITFSGYFFLAFVVIFYGCLFLVGRKMMQLLQKEYKVGRLSLLSKEDIRSRFNNNNLVSAGRRGRKAKLEESKTLKLTSVVPVGGEEDEAGGEDETGTEEGVGREESREEEQEEESQEEAPEASPPRFPDVFASLNRPLSAASASAPVASEHGDTEDQQLQVEVTLAVATDTSVKVGSNSYRARRGNYFDKKSEVDGRHEDSGDEETHKEARRAAKQQEDAQFRPLRKLMLDSDSDDDSVYSAYGSQRKVDELKVLQASAFLKEKGITLKPYVDVMEYVTVAEAVKLADEETAGGHGSLRYASYDSDSDGESSCSEAAVLEAYGYLGSRGISVDEDINASMFVRIARCIQASAEAEQKRRREDEDRTLLTYQKFVRYSDSSSDE